jgi:hypothetical protein
MALQLTIATAGVRRRYIWLLVWGLPTWSKYFFEPVPIQTQQIETDGNLQTKRARGITLRCFVF